MNVVDFDKICECGHKAIEHKNWFTVPPGCDICHCKEFVEKG